MCVFSPYLSAECDRQVLQQLDLISLHQGGVWKVSWDWCQMVYSSSLVTGLLIGAPKLQELLLTKYFFVLFLADPDLYDEFVAFLLIKSLRILGFTPLLNQTSCLSTPRYHICCQKDEGMKWISLTPSHPTSATGFHFFQCSTLRWIYKTTTSASGFLWST